MKKSSKSFVSHSNKINKISKKTRILGLNTTTEGERSLWTVLGCREKPRQIRKSREEDCQREKWAKHEDGVFRWKNQGATKLCRRKTSQVGESGGRRVTHMLDRRERVI